MQPNRILRLAKADLATMRQHGSTPRQIVTRERNWCYYLLAGMEEVCKCLERYCRKDLTQLRAAITSARYSVDAAWYDKCDEIEAGSKRRYKTW